MTTAATLSVRTATYESPLGPMTVAVTAAGLAALWWTDTPCPLRLSTTPAEPDDHCVAATRAWLDAYFAHRPLPAIPALDLHGTEFRGRVWQMLLQIDYGRTTTYGDLARQVAHAMGRPRMSAQAIGQAVGYNPVSLIVPCHRVVGLGGTLTGYAGLIWRKEWLLRHDLTPSTQCPSYHP